MRADQKPTLSYDPAADLGKIVPGRKPAKKYPHNTRLDNGRGTMSSCCKCFKRPSQGACSAHNSEMYVRLIAAEEALKEAEAAVAALEAERMNLGQYTIRAEGGSLKFEEALDAVIRLRHPEKLRPQGATA